MSQSDRAGRVNHKRSPGSHSFEPRLWLLFLLPLLLVGCDSIGWEEFQPADRSFSVNLPGRPKIEAVKADSVWGQVKHYQFSLKKSGHLLLLAYVDPPHADRINLSEDDVLERVCQGMFQDPERRLLNQRHITLGRHPGREIEFANQAGSAKGIARLFFVNNRLYGVYVIGRRDFQPKPLATKVFNSFKILRESN